MKNYWTKTFRRLVAGCAVCGATMLSSAMNYAYAALDNASDPVYADGWQGITNSDASPYGQLTAGDNGGTGFNAWNFNSSYYWDFAHSGTGNWYNYNFNIHAVDPPANPNNNIGKAWDLGIVAYGTQPKFSLPRAGRGFKPLQTGERFSVVIDNPITANFDYKGYSFSLNSAPSADANGMGLDGSICYHASNCTPGVLPQPKSKLSLFVVNTGAGTQWRLADASGSTVTGILTSLTAATGVTIDVDISATTADAYTLTMTPVGGGAPLYTHSGTFANAGLATNWVQFQNYMGVEDPTTHFFISGMSIVPEPATFGLLVLGSGALLGGVVGRRRRS